MKVKVLLILGAVFVVFGAVAPFLIVLKIWPSTFLLNGLAIILSMLGVGMGIIGTAMHVAVKRSDKEQYKHNPKK